MKNINLYKEKFLTLGISENDIDSLLNEISKSSDESFYIEKFISLGMLEIDAKILYSCIKLDSTSSDVEYYIKVDYTTGDSFNTYDETEDINLPWTDINIVTENVQRLKEHVDMYKGMHGWCSNKSYEEYSREWLSKPWAVSEYEIYKKDKERNSKRPAEFSIKLLDNNRKEFILSVGWVGYFEHDQEFSIEIVDKHKYDAN